MAFFTEQQARYAAATNRQSNNFTKRAFEVLSESRQKTTDSQSFDIFLSHSSSDAELILGVKMLLEADGYKVYVDWEVDKQLSRENVNKDTAKLLRTRMKQSSSLIYVATTNASSSKWMPWELGYFDGFKNDAVAILPLTDKETDKFIGQEYLGLYPLVTKDTYSNGKKDTFVEEKGIRWKSLDSFVKNYARWQYYNKV